MIAKKSLLLVSSVHVLIYPGSPWPPFVYTRVIILPPQTRHYKGEIPQNDHTFALFDPPKMGNLMIPVISWFANHHLVS